LTNTEISFTSAMVKVRTTLFGIRYFMRHWFFTTALVAISMGSTSLTVVFIGFYFILRTTMKTLFN